MAEQKKNAKKQGGKKKPEVTAKAGQLWLILRALDGLQGPRSTTMSWELLQVRKPIQEAQDEFVKNIDPFLDKEADPSGGGVPIVEGKEEEAETLMNEEMKIPIHKSFKLKDLKSLNVEHDWHLGLLIDVGIVTTE